MVARRKPDALERARAARDAWARESSTLPEMFAPRAPAPAWGWYVADRSASGAWRIAYGPFATETAARTEGRRTHAVAGWSRAVREGLEHHGAVAFRGPPMWI